MENTYNYPSITHLNHEILPEDYPNYDQTFKIIIIGDAFVGKSSLALKGIKNIFDSNYTATVGFEFVHTNIKINDVVCKLQIWDTCGQEVYRSLITGFYRSSNLAILVYSIDNSTSFDNLDLWIKEIKTYANPDIRIILIANKADLESNRKISYDQGIKYAQDNNIEFFLETSAKTGYNTQKIMIESAKLLYLENLKYKDKNERGRSWSTDSISSIGNKEPTSSRGSLEIKDEDISKVKDNKSSCPC